MDWEQLPSGAKSLSLWPCLHDGGVSPTSDLLAGNLRFEFEVLYLCEFHSLPPELRFVMQFEGVTSVAIDETVIPNGASPKEEVRLHKDAWKAFESAIAQQSLEVEVLQATLTVDRNKVNLWLFLRGTSGDYYPELSISATSFSVGRSDGVPLSLEAFVRLGEDYWDAFAARRRDGR